MKTKRYFICFERKNTNVWGTGSTALEARKDAAKEIKNYFFEGDRRRPNINKDLATVETTKDLFEFLDEQGGENVPFIIIDGKAHLNLDGRIKVEMVRMFVESEIEKLQLAISDFKKSVKEELDKLL